MRVGFQNFYHQLSVHNYCFRETQAGIGDELLLPLNVLAQMGAARGIDFVTLDVAERLDLELDAIIFADYPDTRNRLSAEAMAAPIPKYLITFEPPTVRPENFDEARHRAFEKIFTWDDVLCTKQRYVKVNYAQRFPFQAPVTARTKLCCMIASNKQSSHPLSLYPERLAVARAFEYLAPGAFHLYGPGWEGRPSSRGMVASKRKMMLAYDFAICYENARGLPGYITEKIFDCFIAGCIPIYWGAPNITDYVPASCFIDRRGFGRHDDLFMHMTQMSAERKLEYRRAMSDFFSSREAYQFTPDHFAKTILDTLQAAR